MNVHECQAKGLLREYGVAVPPGGVATTPAEAEMGGAGAPRRRGGRRGPGGDVAHGFLLGYFTTVEANEQKL
ncbi:MAG: hypothetical protein JRS35_11175 [Deltaproteobacteria bacterium]|nr:hypothetical protein [Deltaproteobacteria bacterium]